MTAVASDLPGATVADVAVAPRQPRSRLLLYLLLGFSAGLPFYMFSTVLSARLFKHGVDIVLIGFFSWVSLLATVKFLWAPLLDRFPVPGFARFFGKRLGWIMLSQLGIFLSMVAMAFTSADTNLPVVALFAVLLAFWTTTLEVSADAWRIELAPTAEEQGPLTAANLWGYRTAMAVSSLAALTVADHAGWVWGYLAVALGAFLPLPILASMRRVDVDGESRGGGRGIALATGLAASAVVLAASLLVTLAIGSLVLSAAAALGIGPKTDVKTAVLVLCLLPFVIMAAALPWIVALPPTHWARRSTWLGPYIDIFWRFRYTVLPLLGFVTFYRMGDVLTLWGVKPLEIAAKYDLTTMGIADGFVTTPSSMAGVALGAVLAVKLRMPWALAIGAVCSAFGNWIFVWLWYAPPSGVAIYTATAIDQFAHGLEGAIFVVYLSLLVNPKYPAAQYAFLSGFAFLLPRLLQGAGGNIVEAVGYDGFFWLSGTLSLAAVIFLPFIAGAKPRPDDS
ncbi:permease [Sphingomonas sp. AR_OL41]|uniref:permease n=1 Tax=Sphingomonas sp. AR_OL41 TaxID=3042729 RepID=UPI00247FFAE4|nr:permease [Sphingomonas sp. AR_OL41]MDH7971158.1 permease [Sphingomonas sp. AR_OL41]